MADPAPAASPPSPPAAAPGAAKPATGNPPAPSATPASPPPGAPAKPGPTSSAPAATPTAPAPAAPAKPATPAPPPPKPTGDFATLAGEFAGSTFAILEDGVGVLTVPTDDLFVAARRVKELGYPLLSLLDGYDRGDHIGVLYAFVRPAERPEGFAELRLRVVMPKQRDGKPADPECASLYDVYSAADWQEREMYDMFGIRFQGHPDLRRMFLPDEWTGHPGRKDYKEPEQFVAMREGEDIVVRTAQEGAW